MALPLLLLLAAAAPLGALAQRDTLMLPGRDALVHLFEWKWNDVADECENYLAPKGYGGVQVSPPTENVVIEGRPWWERYQPISYGLDTRSGSEAEFRSMVQRCNAVGVRVYADVVLNHMTTEHASPVGTSGSTANTATSDYPAVPYHGANFHGECLVQNYNDANEVRNCQLKGLKDLDQSQEEVRDRQVELLNKLIAIGVAGFRIDSAKHIWPKDLQAIVERVDNLSTEHGFPANTRPFIYQQVIDLGGEAVSYKEYTHIGRVLDYRHSHEIGRVFGSDEKLRWLVNWGPAWNFPESEESVVFVDNHDNQRGHGAVCSTVLTHKRMKEYKMASLFMLAHPHGVKRVMSSFAFEDGEQGPPAAASGELGSPAFNEDETCDAASGFVCEHRWPQIANMVGFTNVVGKSPVTNWWDNEGSQIAFGRGDKGFVAFNKDGHELDQTLQTGLPAGTYCDVITGHLECAGPCSVAAASPCAASNGAAATFCDASRMKCRCTGKTVDVQADGSARVVIAGDDDNGAVAIHVNAKLPSKA